MKRFTLPSSAKNRGAAVLLILVFGSIFIILTSVLVSTIVIENKAIRNTIDRSLASEIAESGLEYKRWYLAHNIEDYNGPDNVSMNGDGEYEYSRDYIDPISGEITGRIDYVIKPETFCGVTNNAAMEITGVSFVEDQEYTLQQIHARDSAANYSYIYNEDVQAGADRFIRGRYHSNGLVIMNGRNDSVVSSSRASGVSASPNPHPQARVDLWQNEVASIDFNGLTLDLLAIRNAADTYNGSPVGDNLNDRLFTLNDNCFNYECGTRRRPRTCTTCTRNDAFEVQLINDNNPDEASIRVWELDELQVFSRTNALDEGEKFCDYSQFNDSNHTIENRAVCNNGRATYLGEFALDPMCPVAFFEGNVFLHGEADAKMLIASADLNSSQDTNVYIVNNITYENNDGSDGVTVVSQGSVKIGFGVPDDMRVQGIFIAQNGYFGRDNYTASSHRHRDYLEIIGSIVSNMGGGTQWVSMPSGNIVSGFSSRQTYYDRSLSRRPPPLTPKVSDNYSYIEWRDQEGSR